MTFDFSHHHSNALPTVFLLSENGKLVQLSNKHKYNYQKNKKGSSLTFLLFKKFNTILKITLHLQFYKIVVIFSVLYNLQHVLHPVVVYPHSHTSTLPHFTIGFSSASANVSQSKPLSLFLVSYLVFCFHFVLTEQSKLSFFKEKNLSCFSLKKRDFLHFFFVFNLTQRKKKKLN